MRRSLLIAAVLLASCGTTQRESLLPPPQFPSSAPEGARISAKTAATILRASPGNEDRLLLSIASESAPRGLATQWRIITMAVKSNDVSTFLVGEKGPIGDAKSEPYNAVFDTQTPPFSLEGWTADSTDAARELEDPGMAMLMLLEAEEDGDLGWSVVRSDLSGIRVEAGRASMDTPLPSFVPRNVPRH